METLPTTCRTCGCPLSSPFRVYDGHGNIELGCVDADHDGQLVEISASHRWHLRPEAKKMRMAARRRMVELIGRDRDPVVAR